MQHLGVEALAVLKQHRSHVSTAACFIRSSLPLSGGFRSVQVTQITALRMKQSINNLWAASLIPWETDPINTDQVSAIRGVKAGAVFMLLLRQIEASNTCTGNFKNRNDKLRCRNIVTSTFDSNATHTIRRKKRMLLCYCFQNSQFL